MALVLVQRPLAGVKAVLRGGDVQLGDDTAGDKCSISWKALRGGGQQRAARVASWR